MMRWNVKMVLKDAVVAWLMLPIGIVLASVTFAFLGEVGTPELVQYLLSTLLLMAYCAGGVFLRFGLKPSGAGMKSLKLTGSEDSRIRTRNARGSQVAHLNQPVYWGLMSGILAAMLVLFTFRSMGVVLSVESMVVLLLLSFIAGFLLGTIGASSAWDKWRW